MADKKKPSKAVTRLIDNRTKLIDRIIAAMEIKVNRSQEELLKLIVTEFLDKLDLDGDTIKNTLRNKRLVAFMDTVFKRFQSSGGLELVRSVSSGVTQVIDFNSGYFGTFAAPAKLLPINAQVKESIGSWLGIGERGGLEKNGYLDTILKDSTIKNQVKDMTMGGIVGQKGYQEVKAGLAEYIAGNQEKTGALQRYYRNFVYDTFSVADRTAAKITADKLNFNAAIYEGGLVKKSREFCRKRNGKVFSREEIQAFDPKVAKQPGYNPFTDLGGYGCRHHLNWIPDVLAFALRPELKNQNLE